jgi:hypothetical protein
VSIDPVSAGLTVAPLATTVLAKLRRHDPVINLFRELRSQIKADARIPFAVREYVAVTVAGTGVPWKADAGLALDPYFMACVERLLDDGDGAALEDMRRLLLAHLVFDDLAIEIDANGVIEAIIDIIDRSVGPAQASVRKALHHEAPRSRRDFAALRDVLAAPTRYIRIDVMRAPNSVRQSLNELGHIAPEEAAWLLATFEEGQSGEVVARLVSDPHPKHETAPPRCGPASRGMPNTPGNGSLQRRHGSARANDRMATRSPRWSTRPSRSTWLEITTATEVS